MFSTVFTLIFTHFQLVFIIFTFIFIINIFTLVFHHFQRKTIPFQVDKRVLPPPFNYNVALDRQTAEDDIVHKRKKLMQCTGEVRLFRFGLWLLLLAKMRLFWMVWTVVLNSLNCCFCCLTIDFVSFQPRSLTWTNDNRQKSFNAALASLLSFDSSSGAAAVEYYIQRFEQEEYELRKKNTIFECRRKFWYLLIFFFLVFNNLLIKHLIV